MHGSLKKVTRPANGGAPRSRARRDRTSISARMPVIHTVMPGLEVARAEPRPRETITAFLRRTEWAWRDPKYGWQFRKGLPTIIEINGEAVLRKDWRRRRIGAADQVKVVSFPRGGNGQNGLKQVIGIIALVAVAAFATFITGGGAAALLGAAFAQGTFGAAALGAGVALAGSLVVNALVAPKPGSTNTPTATTDQVYSVQAQGNTGRLGQPLPVWYGRLKAYPDFAATPWGEFVGNDQYLNLLLSVSMGSMSYEKIYVDDTVLWDSDNGLSPTFNEANIAFYEPGQEVTLVPTNVDQSAEVSGQQLPDGTGTLGGEYIVPSSPSAGAWLGPFVANPAGTQAQAIAVDFVLPAGCFTYNKDDGNYGFAKIGLTADYAPCDDAGAQTGPFQTLFAIVRQLNSQSPIRDSIKTNVTPGRYLVRFRREDAGLDSQSGSNSVIWVGLRTFLKGANSFPDVSTVAIRLKASQSTQGSYKFGVLATRKLPCWNGSTFVTQATRSPGWAFLDAAVNTQYGSGPAISKTDFNAVVNFAAGCAARGDTFDYRFDAAVSVPEAFDKILGVARSKHFWLGDTVSVVRDEWRDVPSMLFTDREIVRDTTEVSFTMLGEDDPDAVIVEYVDENTWNIAQVQYPPNGPGGFIAVNAETKRIDGIVNRDQAFRECAFLYLVSIYRRTNVKIGTEYEGRAITLGSVVRVQSELPMDYGYGGAVTAVSGNTLTLNPAPTWDTGPFYIRLRRPNGKFFGPVLCTQGANPTLAVLDAGSLAATEAAQSTTLAAVLAREDGGDEPSFELGTGTTESKLCLLLNGSPNGNDQCTLNLVVDDERVHATDLGTPPVLPNPQFPANDKVPLIVALNARFTQGTAEPKLTASWFPAAGAQYYVADVSYDSGQSWAQVYEGIDNKFDRVVTLAALRLRVQAVGVVRGPYSSVDLDAPTIEIAPNIVALQSLQAGIQYNITELQQQNSQRLADAESRLADQVAQVAARLSQSKQILNQQSWDQRKTIENIIEVTAGDLGASIDDVRTVAINTETAFASYQVTVNAHLGTIDSNITTNATAISTLNSAFAAYQVTVSANFDATNANVTSTASALATLNSAFSSYQTTVNAHLGSLDASVTTNADAITTLDGYAAARWSVDVTVNGFVTGLKLINAGDNISSFTVVANSFQVQLPGYNGGSPTPVFTVGTINGVPAVGLNGANMFLDGTLNARAIVAGSINTVQLAVNGVDITNLIAGAATQQQTTRYSGVTLINAASTTVTMTIRSGTATVMWMYDALALGNSSGSTQTAIATLVVDGGVVRTWNIGVGNGGNTFFGTMCADISGLSDGSHTIYVNVAFGGANFGMVPNAQVGSLRVQDLRR